MRYSESNTTRCRFTVTATHSLPPSSTSAYPFIFASTFPVLIGFMQRAQSNYLKRNHYPTYRKTICRSKIWTNVLIWKSSCGREKQRKKRWEWVRNILYVTLFISFLFSPIMNHEIFFSQGNTKASYSFFSEWKMAKKSMTIRNNNSNKMNMGSKPKRRIVMKEEKFFIVWCLSTSVRLSLSPDWKCYIP